MTIQIAQRIGRALGVSSATKLKELDEALRAYVRAVPPGATVPVSGSIAASQVTSGTFADARVAVTNVTQHQAALSILNSQLPGYTAADVLAKLLTVDGAASGLDADLLDGLSSAAFATAAHLTLNAWTPTDTSGAGLAPASNTGQYFQHGNLVIAFGQFSYPVTASGLQARLSLPVAVGASTAYRQGFVSYSSAATVPLYFLPANGASDGGFHTTAGAAVSNANLSNTAQWFCAIYSA